MKELPLKSNQPKEWVLENRVMKQKEALEYSLGYPIDLNDVAFGTTVREFLEGGGISIDKHIEKGNCRIYNIGWTPVDGKDHDDDSDSKSVEPTNTGTERNRGYSAQISGLTNKIGAIRGWIWEPLNRKSYVFIIPRDEIPMKSDCLRIPFERDGTPRLSNHWWKWEVDRFTGKYIR